jgi:hypothetical protein
MNHELNDLCVEKFKILDRHVEESVEVRDAVKEHELKIKWAEDTVKAIMNSALTIKMSLAGVVVAILLQVGGFIYLWGGLNKTVEVNSGRLNTLEEIHPRLGTN